MGSMLRRLLTGAVIALVILIPWRLHLFHRLHLIALDLGYLARPAPPPPTDVVVVGIDQTSLDKLGPLPWPRRYYAEAIDFLSQAGAKAIALDLWFEDPDPKPENDAALAAAAQRAGNVFFGLFRTRRDANVRFTRSRPELTGKSVREAHINVDPDADGKLRSVEWEVHSLVERVLFLPVALAAWHRGIDPANQHSGDIEQVGNTLRIGDTEVPLQTEAGSPAAAGQPGTFLLDPPETNLATGYVRFCDLSKKPTETFRDKIVIIGQVVQGAQNADVKETVRGRKYGVIVLAEATQQILDQRFLRPVSRYVTLLLLLALALGTPFLFSSRHMIVSIVIFLLLLSAVWAAFLVLIGSKTAHVLEPMPMSAAVLLSLLGSTVLSLGQTRHELIRDAKAMDILRQLGEQVAATTGVASILSGQRPDVTHSFVLPAQTPHVLLQSMGQAVGAHRGGLYLWRRDRARLVCMASFGDSEQAIPAPLVRRINERLVRERRPFASGAPGPDLDLRLPGLPATVLAMPLVIKGETMGAVQLFDKTPTEISPGKRFGVSELRLVAVMVHQATVGLENAMLYEGMRDIFLSATLALANAVDAKDPYTHGHSDRVLRYSERVARAMGLSERDVEITKLAAVLHDIGKIAIPDEILRKPGRLTKAEYEIIRTHPARGEAIIAPLEELKPLIPGIRHHHEWYNGKGYPDSLAATDIPLHARIIGAVDAFDAISSARFYRPARPQREAISEIERCAGTQFDPEVAAFLARTLGPGRDG